jgi:hypothetical protein
MRKQTNAIPQGASGHRLWDSFLELSNRTSIGEGYHRHIPLPKLILLLLTLQQKQQTHEADFRECFEVVRKRVH